MIPSLAPDLGRADVAAWLRVWEDASDAYRRGLEETFRARHVFTFSSARAGLYNILQAHGITGKDVLITAYTCSVVTEAIVQSGNRPVIVDIEEDSFNARMTPEVVRRHEGRLGAVVLTSVFGTTEFTRPEVARGQGFLVILDDALAPLHAAETDKRDYDYVYVSGGVRKPYTSLGGGLVFTEHDDRHAVLTEHLRRTRRPRSPADRARGWLWGLAYFVAFGGGGYDLAALLRRRTHLLDGFFDERLHDVTRQNPDYLCDMYGYQKRVGRRQLAGFTTRMGRRQEIARRYRELLGAHSPTSDRFWRAATPYSHVPFLHPRRDALEAHLLARGIDVERYFDYGIAELPAYGLDGGGERAARVAREILNLPVSMTLTDAELERICREIVDFDRGA